MQDLNKLSAYDNLADMNHNSRWMIARDAASGLARWNGKVSQAKLAALCKDMGIERPVKIKPVAAVTRNGCHRIKLSGGDFYHSITMNTYLSVYRANATLKHELEHAAQVERALRKGILPAEFLKQYKRDNRRYGYHNNPAEVEARQASLTQPDVIVQAPLLTERESHRARLNFPQGWLTHLISYQKHQAAAGEIPVIREHFKRLLEDERDVVSLFADGPVKIEGMDEAVEHARRRFIGALSTQTGTLISENTMSDKSTDERREVEAKLRAWRDERGMAEPPASVWRVMVDKALAKTNVQTP